MWALVGIFVSSFVVGLSGALMPGPVLTVTIAEATRRGFWAGPLIVLGHGIIELALVIALVLGLGSLLKHNLVFGIIGTGGAIVLIWMAIGMLRGVRGATLKMKVNQRAQGKPILAGLLTSVANPYFTLWWATIGLSYIALSQRYGIVGLSSFYSGHIMADVVWYFSVAAAITAGKRVINDQTYRFIISACGVFLIALAIYFGAKGIGGLM
ncbi:MAG: LysE family transporter [Deltaproteobacteria bacterium]|nr:MAG: LysE family transporter [Deltaproteobacteria bacterium]